MTLLVDSQNFMIAIGRDTAPLDDQPNPLS
jgi:hypothetical protein